MMKIDQKRQKQVFKSHLDSLKTSDFCLSIIFPLRNGLPDTLKKGCFAGNFGIRSLNDSIQKE